MKKARLFLTLVAIACCAFMLSSCAGINESQVDDRGQAQVTLSQNNYRVVSRVSGEVSCHRVLGFIGGLSNEYLKHSAISNMYDNAHLQGSQAIIDIHVVKSTKIGLFVTDEVMIATGTVIEFTGPSSIRLTK